MNQSRPVGTNASDSAPGVDDGRVAGAKPSVHKPGGRSIAWIIVGLSLVILLAVFIAKPKNDARVMGDGTAAVGAETTAAEVENSTVPGTLNAPVTTPSQRIGPDGQVQPAQPAAQPAQPAQ